MESIQKRMKSLAYVQYQKDLKEIPKKIAAHDLGIKIGKLWVTDKITNSRTWEIDKSFPIYLKLGLSYNDELCREPQVFIEYLEDMLGKELPPKKDNIIGLQMIPIISFYLTLIFTQGTNKKCHIIQEKRQTIQEHSIQKVICTY